MSGISERLAEIRANDDLVHSLHGSGWEDHATDAEQDRSALLAAVDTAMRFHDPVETANGVKVCPRCSRAAGSAVQSPCEEMQAIAAALTQNTKETL